MFKTIPGNNKYIISLSQELRDVQGYSVEIETTTDNRIIIELFGEKVKVSPKWLSLLAHFEIILPDLSFKSLLNVHFVQTDIRFFRPISSNIPVFLKPVEFTHDHEVYRVIPNYSRYAVSAKGNLIIAETKESVNVTHNFTKHKKVVESKYPSVYIYDPDKTGYRYVYLHRLVGYAWVKHPNNDFIRKPIVNHKDGNKSNYAANNLEWCSFHENNLHAYKNGLHNDNIECLVRDFETKKIYEFHSKSQAAEFMDVSKSSLNDYNFYLRKGKLLNDRYEFKLKSDKSEWFYENCDEKIKPGRYLVKTQDKKGNIKTYNDLRDFKKDFAIWNVPNVKEIIKVAKIKHPDVKFEFEDLYRLNGIQCLNTKTGEMFESKTIIEMERKTGIPEHKIRNCVRGNESWTYKGYAFRLKNDSKWCSDFVERDLPRGKPLIAENTLTGEVLRFNSLREASRSLRIKDRHWIKNCVENSEEFKGWKFKHVDIS